MVDNDLSRSDALWLKTLSGEDPCSPVRRKLSNGDDIELSKGVIGSSKGATIT